MLTLLVAALTLFTPLPGGDDVRPFSFRAAPVDDPRLQQADSIFEAGEPAEALRLTLRVLEEGGEDYDALWRAASFALAVGVVEEADRGHTDYYGRAVEYATRAQALEPRGIEGLYWEVAAVGRLAMGAGPREASAYADRIREGAIAILDQEPEHAGAHHALGKLYAEIMSVSGISRFFGRTFVRSAALDEASWTLAEDHLERAATLAPEMILFQLDLARLYRDRRRTDEARRVLEAAAQAPIRQPGDRIFQEEARALLREIS
ncbi:MAG: hypothetical protein EA422_07670 [Gemmatimonadales bacterium]|nr:MAG: hypothetical protein EA422_07670 [Gemmatimonadales bacterium]